MIEFELGIAERPRERESESVTVPVNPFIGEIVIVDVPVAPVPRGPTVVGLALIEKSGDRTTKFPNMGPL